MFSNKMLCRETSCRQSRVCSKSLPENGRLLRRVRTAFSNCAKTFWGRRFLRLLQAVSPELRRRSFPFLVPATGCRPVVRQPEKRLFLLFSVRKLHFLQYVIYWHIAPPYLYLCLHLCILPNRLEQPPCCTYVTRQLLKCIQRIHIEELINWWGEVINLCRRNYEYYLMNKWKSLVSH